MKRIFAFILTITMSFCILTSIPLDVAAASKNNLTFVLSKDKKSYSVKASSNTISGDVVIPATYKNKPVIRISGNGFYKCKKIKSITIPESVKEIGYSAFAYSKNLTSISLPDSIELIEENAFYDTGYYNDSNNWSEKVLYIGNHLIRAKRSVKENYRIKSNTITIADYAFSGVIILSQ